MMQPWIWKAFVLSFATAAAVGDVYWRRIPAWFSVFGALIGFGYYGWRGSFLPSLGAAGIGFAVGLALFHLGAIGGGDVKLLTAMGALLGLSKWTLAMELAVIAAGLIACCQIIHRGAVRQVLNNINLVLAGLWSNGFQPHPEVHVKNAAMIRAPFGVAAAVGTAAALIVR